MKTSNAEPHGLHAIQTTRGNRSGLLAGAKGMVWRDPVTESVGQIRDMTVVGLTLIDNEDGTGILTTGGGGGSSGGGIGIETPGWFNVKKYGALGSGVADDLDAVNDAIAALTTAGGGVLYFPKGQYLISDGLDPISVGCVIRGDGRDTSWVKCSSATAVAFSVTANSVSFEHLVIDNTSGSTPSAGAGIKASGAAGGIRMRIESCYVRDFYDCIDIQDGFYWSISDSSIYNPVRYGLRIRDTQATDSGDSSISNTDIVTARAADAAIRIESGGGVKIVNSKINGPTSGTDRFVHGIDVAPSDDTGVLLMTNNSIENVSGDGIHIATNGDQWEFVLINGNQFGMYGNSTGNAIDITCTNLAEVDILVITDNMFRQTGGGTAAAITLTKVNLGRIADNIRDGFGQMVTTSGCTNIIDHTFAPGHQFGAALFTSGVSITATTEATANSIIAAPATAFDGQTPIYVEFFSPGARPDSTVTGRQLDFWLYDDTGGGAASIGRMGFMLTPAASTDNKPILLRYFLTPSAATHTYSVRGSVNGGAGNVGAGAGGNGATMPGYIRLFKH